MINTATLIARCLSPILLSTIALSTVSMTAYSGNMYIYKDKGGQVLLTNVNPSGNFDKFTKKVKVTYYKSNNTYDSGSSTDYGRSAASNSGSRNAYDGYIRASATRHGVDPALMKAMMHTESAFNPNARSPVGAQGLMQLMPATARRFKVSNPWNPADNIEGSANDIGSKAPTTLAMITIKVTFFRGNPLKFIAASGIASKTVTYPSRRSNTGFAAL